MAEPTGSAQETQIIQKIDLYLEGWKSHGSPVPGKAEILYGHFVVVRAQPGSTSGCSIDDMTRSVTNLIEAAGCRIIPSNVVFYRNEGQAISSLDFRELGAAISSGTLRPDTTIFTTSMMSESEFGIFEQPLSKSWAARLLPKTV